MELGAEMFGAADKHNFFMGILDKYNRDNHAANNRRAKILGANIADMERRLGLTHDAAVERFANSVGRSKKTIYAWLTQSKKRRGGPRPIPVQHYDRLVELGLIDPKIGRIEEDEKSSS